MHIGDGNWQPYSGPISLNAGRGAMRVSGCVGPVAANAGVGGFSASDWMGEIHLNLGRTGTASFTNCDVQHATVNSGTGEVRFEGGTLGGLRLNARGAVVCTSVLGLVPSGGTPPGEQTYEVNSSSGDISFTLPKDVPARIEAVVKDGEVVSDVPLVSAARQGPRGAARRFVGVSAVSGTRNDPPKLTLRLRSDRGNIRLHLDGMVRTRTSGGAAEGGSAGVGGEEGRGGDDDEVRAVLAALARREISVDEAEALLERIG
jgi:hypothetical protein